MPDLANAPALDVDDLTARSVTGTRRAGSTASLSLTCAPGPGTSKKKKNSNKKKDKKHKRGGVRTRDHRK